MAEVSPSTVAVIDIGSNSIKVLVACRTREGRLRSLLNRTLDVRISTGISQEVPRLSEEGMRAGLAAVQGLIDDSEPFRPATFQIVATSAVRDAVNGNDFRTRVKSATGLDIRILTGEEEANLIGRGLLTDPAVASFRDFYLFDLGGGSLECLCFREQRAIRSASLPLGCVRLTEKWVADPRMPFGPEAYTAVTDVVTASLRDSAFVFDLGDNPDALFIGGTLTTARFILAAARGVPPDSAPTCIPISDLRALYDRLAPLTLSERKQVPALPPQRADVMPAALATALAVAEMGRIQRFHTSFHNLRWGIADEILPAA